jgi:Trypsin-like peptidase domain
VKGCLAVLLMFPIAALAQDLATIATNPTVKLASGQESPDSARIEAVPRIASELQTVVPITKLRIYGLYQSINFGSGFCLDPECRFIVTNYHVAKGMGKHFSIQRDHVVQWWLASSPNDEGATEKGYNPLQDLAILELRRSLSYKGFHGLPYNMEDLAAGKNADIYSFPLEFSPKRKLQHFRGQWIGVNQNGLLVFSYEPNPLHVRGGASGGLILDSTGRVMAVLADVATDQKNVVLGVPVSVLSAFVYKIQPYLAARLFPRIAFMPPVEPDRYPEWVPPRPDGRLERRPIEPPDVELLRLKAQDVVNTMHSLISVESFEWGEDSATSDPQAIGYYEVRTFDGHQHYREYPDGEKEMDAVAWPALTEAVEPGDAWSDAAKLVAKQYDLRIRRAPDIMWKGQSLRVFQYLGRKEDNVCEFDDETDFIIFVRHDIEAYDCSGEVWTDQDENLVRISENFHTPNSRGDPSLIVTFGWTDVEGERLLVPVTVWMQAEASLHVYWCHEQFTGLPGIQVHGAGARPASPSRALSFLAQESSRILHGMAVLLALQI